MYHVDKYGIGKVRGTRTVGFRRTAWRDPLCAQGFTVPSLLPHR